MQHYRDVYKRAAVLTFTHAHTNTHSHIETYEGSICHTIETYVTGRLFSLSHMQTHTYYIETYTAKQSTMFACVAVIGTN